MLQRFLLYSTLNGILLSLASCMAYAPTSPSVPLVAARGEVEVSGSTQLNGRLEGRGIYSPFNHVLVGASGSTRPNFSASRYFRVQQAEAVLGGYTKLNRKFLLSGMLGTGIAHTDRRFEEILGAVNRYQANYNTVFGQVGVAKQVDNVSVSLGYRLTSVKFRSIKDEEIVLPLRRMTRSEMLMNIRFDLGATQRWQAQASTGFSVGIPSTPEDDPATEFGVQYNQLPSLLASLGVVWRPYRH